MDPSLQRPPAGVPAPLLSLTMVGEGGNSTAPFHPGNSAGGNRGILEAAVFVITAFIGFEAATALGEESRDPKRVTVTMAKDQRGGRVFVDWSQNDRHKTTVCAYSLRATDAPGVSTPVSWDMSRRCSTSGSAPPSTRPAT